MNVIFSNYDDINNPYYAGGGAIVIRTLSKMLSRFYPVTVITGRYKGSRNETIDNVNYLRIGTDKFGAKIGQLLYQALLPYYVRKLEFSIWFETFTPPFSTACLQLFTKKPVVGVTHFFNAKEKSKEYKLPFFLIERIGIKTYKHIIALSSYMKYKIRQHNSSAKVYVIPNGVNKVAKKYLLAKEKNYCLFVGRIEKDQKGLDLLITSYKRAFKSTNLPLYIAGTGVPKEVEELKHTIKKHGLKRQIMLLGRIEGEKKKQLMSEARFILVPSRYESFSIVVLESIAMGKPIICFDIEGLKWVSKANALKSKPFDTTQYAQDIVRLSTDHKLRHAMQKNALTRSGNYSWNTIVGQYRKIITSLT